MNKLILDSENVFLEGFHHLNTYITFAFYPNGIVIFDEKKEDRDYYYGTILPESKTLHDKKLIEELSHYSLSKETLFIYSGDSYIEMEPSTRK